MIKKQFLLAIVISLLFITGASAQKSSSFNSSDYRTALGVKLYPGALSIKHFTNETAALEGLLHLWNKGFRVTGLYELHYNINDVDGLKWYIGPGAHIGAYNDNYGGGGAVGIDGVLGLDYKFSEAPINVSLDWQPYFEFGSNNYNGFNASWVGLAIRYTF